MSSLVGGHDDALEAGVLARPHISSTGPTTPPARIAPASHGASGRVKAACGEPLGPHRARSQAYAASPSPDPTYSKPAISTGSTGGEIDFASGVLAPKSTAASSAFPTPFQLSVVLFIRFTDGPQTATARLTPALHRATIPGNNVKRDLIHCPDP